MDQTMDHKALDHENSQLLGQPRPSAAEELEVHQRRVTRYRRYWSAHLLMRVQHGTLTQAGFVANQSRSPLGNRCTCATLTIQGYQNPNGYGNAEVKPQNHGFFFVAVELEAFRAWAWHWQELRVHHLRSQVQEPRKTLFPWRIMGDGPL